MNRFALTAFWRSLARHRLYSAINIGGLAVGIAVFLMLTIYVRFENSYEKWLPGWQNIYQIKSTDNGSESDSYGPNTPIALWSAVLRDLPGVTGTRLDRFGVSVIKNGVATREMLGFVDRKFPKVFALPVIGGDFANAFADPSNIVLTRDTALKYFGDDDPLGKTMNVIVAGKTQAFRVAAVVENRPPNSDLTYDMLARIKTHDDKSYPYYNEEHQWNYFDVNTYVRLMNHDAVVRFADDLKAVIHRHAQSETPDNPGFAMSVKLERISDIHFDAPGKALAVTTLAIVGALTLLVAVVNYVNLATARAGLRAREVAMRKVLGADRKTLLRHYTGEALATTAVAALIGLALAEAAIPAINAAADLQLSIRYVGHEGILLPLLLLVLVVGLVAGAYPAVLLSRFPAAAVLASSRSPGGGRAGARLREGLVVAQFAIAIAFVIGTLVLTAQTAHVRNADIGFQRQGLMLVQSLGDAGLNDAKRDTIMHRLATLPGVASIAVADNAPGPGSFTAANTLAVPGVPGDGPLVRFFQTMPGFFDTMGAHLLAGRLFDPSRQADVDPNYRFDLAGPVLPFKNYNIVVNRAAVEALHVPTPQAAIGRTFGGRTIIGVVENMRFDDPRAPIPPTAYEFLVRKPNQSIGFLRFTGDAKAMHQAVQQVWREEAPEVPLFAETVVQNLETYYQSDDRSARLFTIGAVLAVAIGCVGLWGLASFNTARRVKEVGIRKTLGASTADVVKLLVGQFLRPVLLANIVAWPLAFFAMRTWLAGFDDRIALSPLYFVGATLLALAIAVLTVVAQSVRAARATPSWALRHE